MKKWFISLLTAVALLAALAGVSAQDAVSGGYSVTNYDMDIAVHENNVYTVTETIDVLFSDGLEPQHGIYRDIPVVTTFERRVGGKEVNRTSYALITDLEISDSEGGDVAFEAQREGDDYEIRIGDSDVEVTGEHTYIIKYRYDVGADNISEYDDIYLNLLDRQDIVINSFSFTMHMPKEFDRDNVFLYFGGVQESGVNIDYHITSDSVYGVSRAAVRDSDITIRILLDEGYFVGARQMSNGYITAAIIVTSLLTACSAVLWLLFGRSRKVSAKASFYPPPGITPADVGYILKGSVNDGDMAALILYWADKGYLNVRRMEDGTIRLMKRRDPDAGLQDYEKRIFDRMFGEGDDVSLMSIQRFMPPTLRAAKKDLQRGFSKNPFRRIHTKKSKVVQALNCLFSGVCIGIFAGVTAYSRMYSVGSFILYALSTAAVYFALAMLSCEAVNRLPRHKDPSRVLSAFSINMVIVVFAGFIMIGVSYLIAPVFIGIIGTALCNIFAAYGLKRTEQGDLWLAELSGLREQISASDARQMAEQLQNNADYFYNILPYAHILGVGEKWIGLFDPDYVSKPQWYDAGAGPFDADAFHTMCTALLDRQIFGAHLQRRHIRPETPAALSETESAASDGTDEPR